MSLSPPINIPNSPNICRDCASPNIMMDGNHLYPGGFHPIRQICSPDGTSVAWPMSRSHFHVQYYYIDFSLSVYIPPDVQPKLVVGIFGRDQEPPELSDSIPYDPFKLDVFILGNVLRKSFYDVGHPLLSLLVSSHTICFRNITMLASCSRSSMQ